MKRRSVRGSMTLMLVLLGLGGAGCNPSQLELDDNESYLISDGVHGGTQGFYFLPPMVPQPAFGGAFEPGLSPVVQIDEIDPSGQVIRSIATFTGSSGPGSEPVRVDAAAEHYQVNWHTDLSGLVATATYRINVVVGDRRLGFADVDVVGSGNELRNVNTAEYIALHDGRTLPIKFRIEIGAGQTADCTNGVRDDLETDEDCGGAACASCADGKRCLVASDCASGVCAAQACQVSTCSDDAKNGGETGVDCGGPCVACPADPAVVAPPLDGTVATNLASAAAFLYTGSAPVQFEVQPGAIDPVRVGVVRGLVLDGDGQPLPSVAVRVLDHPEYGFTLSRADGLFDLAVNGGGPLIVDFQKSGRLPLQRTVTPPWQDYTWLPEVTMIRYDGQVTAVDLAQMTSLVTARGGQVTDASGVRQATLLFSPGTEAQMTVATGSQPLTTLHVRATEYTVGPRGPSAMPGALPPSSGYTYAVELSVDEAVAAGATDVQFTKPVVFYVENFLEFPVGGPVPTGYYDRQRAVWIASDDGRVIKLLTGGTAPDLDVTGGGTAADDATLSSLGITLEERQQLGGLYPAGASLWRVPVTHFTPYDCNWPFGPGPNDRPPNQDDPEPDEDDDDCERSGSIIGCQGQTLGENADVSGTPFRLHYKSDRAPGSIADRSMTISLSGATPPATLKRIELEVLVAGQRFTQTFSAAPNQRTVFTWDRKDAYGRTVQGQTAYTVNLGYVYDAYYQIPAQLRRTFGALSGGGFITGDAARQEITLGQTFDGFLGSWDARGFSLGGWSLDIHHAYDPLLKTLYLGNGVRRRTAVRDHVVKTIVGGSFGGFSGDGGPAATAQLRSPSVLAVSPDGTLYISDSGNYRIRRMSPNGIITTIAGNGTPGFSGDGGPATSAQLGFNGATGLAVGSDGSLYLADRDNHRIRRVSPNGIISTVAGGGTSVNEGVPATEASLFQPHGLALSTDGSLFLSDTQNHRVCRVGPDGILTTVAGKRGVSGRAGDGGPASSATLFHPIGLAVGPDGSLYIADGTQDLGVVPAYFDYRVRRVGPDGIIRTFAGRSGTIGALSPDGSTLAVGDGGPATAAQLIRPTALAIGPDGGLYIGESGRRKVRYVAPNGVINTFAGNSLFGGRLGDNGPAPAARFGTVQGVALSPDGGLFVADGQSVRRVGALPSYLTAGNFAVPAEDGGEVYVFDSAGKHLRTLHAFTGATLHELIYDAAGRLSAVRDAWGELTSIERDASGEPTAIVASGGQRTTLTTDANGYLASVADPLGHTTTVTHSSTGLLASKVTAGGSVHQFTYDSEGRLTNDQNPVGGFSVLFRASAASSSTVTLSTAEGRSQDYFRERLATGAVHKRVTNNLGAFGDVVINRDGTSRPENRDGRIENLTQGPDPRWGMQAPVDVISRYTLPLGGLASNVTTQRAAVLSNPDDPLSLQSWSETINGGGGVYARTYAASSRTFTTTRPSGAQWTQVINAQGQPVQVTLGAGVATLNFAYDARGRLHQASFDTLLDTYAYDAANRLTSVTNAAGEVTGYVYDAADRVVQVTHPSGRVYGFAYDADDHPTQITMPSGSVHTEAYNAVDLLTAYTPPGSAPYAFTYNLDGQLTKTTLPGGREITASYDSGGRLTGGSYSEGSVAITYADATARVASATRTPASIGSAETVSTTYNGPLITGLTFSGAASGQYSYRYDNELSLVGFTLTGDPETTVTRDAEGLPVALGRFTITRAGPARTTSQISDGTLAMTFSYDTAGRPAGRMVRVGTTPLYQLDLVHNHVELVSRRTETVGGATQVYNYVYNADHELTQVTRDGVVVETYTYDANGNRISRRLGSSPAESATYDAQDRILTSGSATYLFNADGQMTQHGTTSFEYSADGDLLRATTGGATITYSYDAKGRRVARTDAAGTTEYLYGNLGQPLQLTASRSPTGTLTRYYYDEADRLYAFQRGTSWYYVASDQIGSPRVVADAAGGVVKRVDYDSFGVAADANPDFDLAIGYAGGLGDTATGLVRFGQREYDPASGRWTTRDPLFFDGGQGNLYAYAGNDPVGQRDLIGLMVDGRSILVGIAAGASVASKVAILVAIGAAATGVGAPVALGAAAFATAATAVDLTAKAAIHVTDVIAGRGVNVTDALLDLTKAPHVDKLLLLKHLPTPPGKKSFDLWWKWKTKQRVIVKGVKSLRDIAQGLAKDGVCE